MAWRIVLLVLIYVLREKFVQQNDHVKNSYRLQLTIIFILTAKKSRKCLTVISEFKMRAFQFTLA